MPIRAGVIRANKVYKAGNHRLYKIIQQYYNYLEVTLLQYKNDSCRHGHVPLFHVVYGPNQNNDQAHE